jgi:hypothetical protein
VMIEPAIVEKTIYSNISNQNRFLINQKILMVNLFFMPLKNIK